MTRTSAAATRETEAASAAARRVDSIKGNPTERYDLAAQFYQSLGPRLARYGRAELSFLQWEINRGVLSPASAAQPGSPWWRAVNERLLRDKIEATIIKESGEAPSAFSVRLWSRFIDEPSPASWYRAHNASIVGGYVENEELALAELPAERFMMNVALLRVLYAHALVAAPRLALGLFAPLGTWLGDPRRGSTGFFLDLHRVFPQRYPLVGYSLPQILDGERPLGRWLDFGIICTRLLELYTFAAQALELPHITSAMFRDGTPSYAGAESIQLSSDSLMCRLIARITRPRAI